MWDALGVPAMLGRSATIEITNPVGGDGTTLEIPRRGPGSDTPGLVHFAVPAAHWWDDVGYT